MERVTKLIAARNQRDYGSQDEKICAFCFEFPIEPVKLLCSHTYCYYCITEYLNFGKQSCPMCRKAIDFEAIQVDKKLKNEMKEKYLEKYAIRLREINEIVSNLVFIKLGNTHERLESIERNRHKWTCFIRFFGETEKKIDHVVFTLHETFIKRKRKVDKAPFEVKSIGWGYFTVKIDVVFKKSTGIKNMKFEHELCFDGNGTSDVIKRPLAYLD